jgi:UDP-4-amino-4,6-dideoxy-N-acetyl-beta-L-altrosamine N-acetyltransferase
MYEPGEFSLRELKPTDQDTILRWRNSEFVRQQMFKPDVIGAEDHERWFKQVLATDPSLYRILSLADRDLGFVSFTRKDDSNATCTWGLYIGEPDAPRGSGSALGSLALTHAFTELAADEVISEAMASNDRAIRLYDRLGFRRVDTRVITRTTPGTPEDVIVFLRSRVAWAVDAPDVDGYATADG